jgi:hypothetical protein
MPFTIQLLLELLVSMSLLWIEIKLLTPSLSTGLLELNEEIVQVNSQSNQAQTKMMHP